MARWHRWKNTGRALKPQPFMIPRSPFFLFCVSFLISYTSLARMFSKVASVTSFLYSGRFVLLLFLVMKPQEPGLPNHVKISDRHLRNSLRDNDCEARGSVVSEKQKQMKQALYCLCSQVYGHRAEKGTESWGTLA
jgi:hypothetical protein